MASGRCKKVFEPCHVKQTTMFFFFFFFFFFFLFCFFKKDPTQTGLCSHRKVQVGKDQEKTSRSLKFWNKTELELYYPCSENKGADQLLVHSYLFMGRKCL